MPNCIRYIPTEIASDPIDTLKYVMRYYSLTVLDMQDIIGDKTLVSKILTKQRPLTLRMIRKLHTDLGIPADILIKSYKLIC